MVGWSLATVFPSHLLFPIFYGSPSCSQIVTLPLCAMYMFMCTHLPMHMCLCVHLCMRYMQILWMCACVCIPTCAYYYIYMCMCLCVFMDLYVCVSKYVVMTCVEMCITWIPPIGEMCIIVLWSLVCLAPCGDPCEITDHFKHIFYKNGSLPPLASPIMGGMPWELRLALWLWLSHNSNARVYIPEQHLDLGEEK